MRTRVKICGFTRASDALAAVSAGVDALGLVFYPPSPRALSIDQAEAICAVLPPFVSVVGLFVNPEPEWVRDTTRRVALDCLQFHGDESPEFCSSFAKPYFKAIRMAQGVDLALECQRHQQANAILVDSYQPGHQGGTGAGFDWQRLPKALAKPLILAGGLSAENARQAIEQVHPYALDVSSGVESAKGIKDTGKMTAFMTEVTQADIGKHS
ncbi:MAG: phosphoribosylanthranilate isomerase [Methylococcales bacterium]|nr:phosphoribosylanthranilate isomerase [Methylococcales bacterium]